MGWRIVKPNGVMLEPTGEHNVINVRLSGDVARDSLPYDGQVAAFRAQIEENRTYNHTPHRHHVLVPTRSGEPVRG